MRVAAPILRRPGGRSSMARVRPPPNGLEALLALMEPWPQSWAGFEEDEPVGRQLVELLRPFMRHLDQRKLSRKTLRRHLDNLWLLGGKIIRDVDDEPALRDKPARDLLLTAIAGGEAPLIRGLTEAEQRSVDAPARKLLRILSAPGEPLPSVPPAADGAGASG